MQNTMAEQQGDEFNSAIEGLAMTDPAIERVLAAAHQFQHQLDTAPSDQLHALGNTAVGVLDGMWQSYMNQPAMVSGRVRQPVIDVRQAFDEGGVPMGAGLAVRAEKGSLVVADSRLNDAECISRGFIIEDEEFTEEGELVGYRPVIKLLFQRAVNVNLYNENASTVAKPPEVPTGPAMRYPLECMGKLDEIRVRFEMESPEFSRQKSAYYFAENVDSLDMVRVNGAKVADKLLALARETVSLPDERPDFDATESLAALQSYANYCLGLARLDSVFVTDIEPDALLLNTANGEVSAYDQQKHSVLMTAFGLKLTPKLGADATGEESKSLRHGREYEYRLVARLAGETPEQDTPAVAVRLRDISSVESIRDFFNN